MSNVVSEYITNARKILDNYLAVYNGSTDLSDIELYKDDKQRIESFLKQPQFSWNPMEAVRLSLGPEILHKDIQQYCTDMEEVKWFAEEVRFDLDALNWKVLDEPTKHVVKFILGFFSIADQIVLDNISSNLKEEINCIDVQHVYVAQEEQERIHQKSYLFQTQAILRGDELKSVLNAIRTMKTVKKIAKLMKEYTNKDKYSLGIRIVANTLGEGVLFSGCFAFLQWLRERKDPLPGITQANEYIMRDEGIHTKFGCYLIYKYVDIAVEFINEAIVCDMAGMNTREMKKYIEFQADCVVEMMGYPAIYNSECPFKFMEKIGIGNKNNFFEKQRGTDYTNEINSENIKVDFSKVKKLTINDLDQDFD
jgi:ribonucleotide reductase beta subunit family protein with ferritin-like domain